MKRQNHTQAGLAFLAICFVIALVIYVGLRSGDTSPEPAPQSANAIASEEVSDEMPEPEEASPPTDETVPENAPPAAAADIDEQDPPQKTTSIFRPEADDSSDPEEAKAKPDHSSYVSFCVGNIEKSEGGFGSGIDRSFAKATCECQYSKFPEGDTMTKVDYMSAGIICLRQKQQDAEDFLERYSE